MIKIPTHLLEACNTLFAQLLDEDERNNVGGAYLGEEFLAEVADLDAQIKRAIKNNVLVVRKRTFHGRAGWWIGRGAGKNFSLYTDLHAPGGYGFGSRTSAELRLSEIEKALAQEETARRTSRRRAQGESNG